MFLQNNSTSTLFDYAGCMRLILFFRFCHTQVSQNISVPQTFYEHLKNIQITVQHETVSIKIYFRECKYKPTPEWTIVHSVFYGKIKVNGEKNMSRHMGVHICILS